MNDVINSIQAEFNKDISAKYRNHILDIEAEVAESKFLASRNGIGIIPQGELLALKGKAKMGKSQFEYFLAIVLNFYCYCFQPVPACPALRLSWCQESPV